MEKRGIVKAIIFSFITFGIYGVYWFYKLTNEAHQVVGRNTTASGGWALLYTFITLGIYYIYWSYKMGESITEAKRMRGMHTSGNDTILYLILSLFGAGIVTQVLLQDSINDIIDYDSTSGNV
ncbi:MAG: DUF4234 domain-containing protein [Selenomonadaceae bacterium]